MKNRVKRLLVLGMIVTLPAGMMSGCSGSSETGSKNPSQGKNSKTEINKDYVYKETTLEEKGIEVDMDSLTKLAVRNDRVYMQGSKQENDTSIEFVVSMNADGSDRVDFQLKTEEVPNVETFRTSAENDLEMAGAGEAASAEDGALETAVSETLDVSGAEASAETELASETEAETTVDSSEIAVEEDMEDYSYVYTYYSHMAPDADGNIFFIKEVWTDEYINGNYNGKDEYSIVKYDKNGEQLDEVPLQSGDEAEYISVSGMQIDDAGNLYLIMGEKDIVVYDQEMKEVKRVSCDGFSSFGTMNMIGSELLISGWDANYEKQQFVKMNMQDYSFSEVIPFQDNSYSYSFYGCYQTQSGTTDLLLTNSEGVCSWTPGTTEVKKLMNYVDSDVNTSYFNNIVAIDDKTFIASYNDNVTWEQNISFFEKVDPKDVADKEPLTFACYYLDSAIRSEIVAFNKSSDKYRIQVTEYSLYDSEESSGVQKMNTEIASGNIPDIFSLDNELPVQSYMEKGLFTDLKPYLEKDSELDASNYYQNVMDAFSNDGKWYVMVPRYTIKTYVTKASFVEGKNQWTIEDVEKLLEQYPDAMFSEECTKSEILRGAMEYTGTQFIDWEKGTCNFQNEGFIQLLEFANRFPEEINYEDEQYWNEFYENYDYLYRKNQILAQPMYLSTIRDVNYTEKGTFGEKISFVGFPTQEGHGGYIQPSYQFAISSKCNEQDGAWEFLKRFLKEDFQQGEQGYGMPLSKTAMKKLCEEAKERPHYTDDKGEEVYYDETYNIGNAEVVLEQMTDEDIERVLSYIESVTNTYGNQSDISDIVMEEAASYFSGQKSAQDVAAVIQSRAQIYVDENM